MSTMVEPDRAVDQLDLAADPTRGGNAGLGREARALRRYAKYSGVQRLMAALQNVRTAVHFLEESEIIIGPRLNAVIQGAGT